MKLRWLAAALVVGFIFALFTPLPERLSTWFSRDRAVAAQSPSTAACPADAPPADLDFTLKDMNGAEVKLASLKGKVILLNFWATWCEPCRIEMPRQVGFDGGRKEGHPVFIALPATYEDLIRSEVHVLDAQARALQQAESGAVEERRYQPRCAADSAQNRLHLVARQNDG